MTREGLTDPLDILRRPGKSGANKMIAEEA
jgi:hypothetical protein